MSAQRKIESISEGVPPLPRPREPAYVIKDDAEAIAVAERLAERVVVLNITAPIAVLAQRLAARGREAEADIAARLKREAPLTAERAEIVTILNDRSVAEAAGELLAVLRALGRHGS